MGTSVAGVPGWQHGKITALPKPYQNYFLTGRPPMYGGYGLVLEGFLQQEEASLLLKEDGQPSKITPRPEPFQNHVPPIGRQRLALKFVRPGVPESHPDYRDWINLFLREASAGLTIEGPNLARSFPVLDLRNHAGWLPLVIPMPFYDLNLAEVLLACRDEKRRLPPSLVTRWSRQLGYALQDMHRQGFAHRDVKPSNILLAIEGSPDDLWAALDRAQVKLGDFTTICHTADLTKEVFAVQPDQGEVNWKAPELQTADADARRRAQRSPTQDIYSLGLVLEHLAKVTDGNTNWLRAVATACQSEPEKRPPLDVLIGRLSPDYAEHARLLTSSGHQPGEHPHFTGRTFVRSEFDRFADRCVQDGRGGVFVVEAVAGVGKTALMTHWAEEQPARTAFYFRFRDGRTLPSAMPEQLCRQLCAQHNLTETSPSSNPSDRLRALLRQLADQETARPRQHLLFIDGLDESTNPAEAVTYIPATDLPAGVFFIVSSRPPTGSDYLGPLVNAGTHRYCIDPESEENLADLERYFASRLGARLTAGQARQLAEASGGMFQLAVLLAAEATRADNPVAPEEILNRAQAWVGFNPDRRMYAYYEETWRRIRERLRPEYPGVEHNLNAFAQVLAVAQDWLDLDQTLEMLYWLEDHGTQRSPARWNPTVFAAIQEELRWLLEERPRCWYGQAGTGYIQLRHQSMRDFFVSAEGMKGVRLGLSRMHADIGAYYLAQASERRSWIRVDPYGRFYSVRHLLLAERDQQVQEAVRLLSDFDYLQATLGTVPPGQDNGAEENLS
jgi:serine/threonine protein kinase